MNDKTISRNRRLLMSNFKLNSLLEITLSINENLPVEELLEKYEKILKEDLEIGKVIIFKLGDTWECLLNSGFKKDLENTIIIEKDLLPVRDILPISSVTDRFSDEVDIIIPVIHKEEPIAFVLIGDIDEESEGVSPIIKHMRFIQTLSNIIIVAIENIRLYKENLRQVAIKRELELASRMQNMLIPEPDKLPSNSRIHFKAFYHPHYEVGGDYYDVVKLSNDEYGLCIADVSGKGMSAAILMSNFQANLRALFTSNCDLEDLVRTLNDRVMQSAKGEKFITLFIAKYNCNSKELEYINAGHNPPLIYDIENNKMDLLKSGCVGIGMLDSIPFINIEKRIVEKNTKMLLYTDGLVEVIEGEGVEFGTSYIEEEISNKESIDRNIEDIILHQKIETENTTVFDDISILGIQFNRT